MTTPWRHSPRCRPQTRSPTGRLTAVLVRPAAAVFAPDPRISAAGLFGVEVLHSDTFRVLFDHFRDTSMRRPAMPRCSGWWALPLQRPGVMECRASWG
jgi:hypothetical protein